MKREDFHVDILEQVETYSEIIVAMLAMGWNVPKEQAEDNKELKKNVESQLIFFLTKCRKLDSIIRWHDVDEYYIE